MRWLRRRDFHPRPAAYGAAELMLLHGALAILLLAGCAGNPMPEVVRVPVATPCLQAEQLPAKPDILPDAALFALDDYRAVLELARARIVLRDAVAERDALLSGCL